MPALQLSNVPDSVVSRLRDEAVKHGRPIDEEAVEQLKHALGVEPVAGDRATEVLRMTDALRASMPDVWMTEEFLRHAREEGRECVAMLPEEFVSQST